MYSTETDVIHVFFHSYYPDHTLVGRGCVNRHSDKTSDEGLFGPMYV